MRLFPLLALVSLICWGQVYTLPCPTQNVLSVVGAGDYSSDNGVASNSLVSVFGPNIATTIVTTPDESPAVLPVQLGGVSATITDSSKNTLPVPLIAVTPGQVNAVLPNGLQVGVGYVNLTTYNGTQICAGVQINQVAPSLFSADNTGSWLAAAQVVISHADGTQTIMDSVAQYSSTPAYNGSGWSNWIPIPINLGTSTDTAVLELFGTGIRGESSYTAAGYGGLPFVSICNQPQYCDQTEPVLTVLYAGPQGGGLPSSFYGLDQVNVILPHSLAGSGINYVDLGTPSPLSASDGTWQVLTANMVEIDIQ